MDSLYIRRISLSSPPPSSLYWASLPPVRHLARWGPLTLDSPVTFFVGENGTGKSTLLEAVAVAAGFNPEGGTRNFHFSTRATHSGLYQYLTLTRGPYRARDGFFLRAESFYNLSSNIDDLEEECCGLLDSYGGVSLHEQSHGESFFSLIHNRFGGRGLYILDEPEAALSPSRLMALLAEIHRLVGADSQFLIATHSPILMAYPGARVFELSPEGIAPVRYRDTAHYQLTLRFLKDPEGMLRLLLKEET